MSSINIFSIILFKLNYQQKFYLVMLLKFEKNLEIHFYYTTLILSLAIGL